MAERITTSRFLESTAVKEVVVKHLHDPIRTGGGPLPDNIKNGIAKFIEAYFDMDEQNRESFRAVAEIEYPDMWNGQYIKGSFTRQWIPYSVDNIEESVARIQAILVGLGGKSILGDGRNVNFFKVVDFLNQATKNKPIYFKFSTSPKKPQGPPKIDPETGEPATVWPWENWYAAIPGYMEKSAIRSSAATTAPTNPTGAPVPASFPTPPTSTRPPDSTLTNGSSTLPYINNNGLMVNPPPDTAPWTERMGSLPPSNSDITYSDSDDIGSLIVRATKMDSEAHDKLTEYAKALGYTDEEVNESSSWEEVGNWVRTGGKKQTTTIVEKPARVIQLDQVYTYSPPDKKDSSKRLKERECKVISIDNETGKITIQNLAKKTEEFVVYSSDEFLK
jgi:hypothetical protein